MQVTKPVYIVSGASYDLLGNVYAIIRAAVRKFLDTYR